MTDLTTVVAGRLDRFADTCNVYLVRSDTGSLLVDFGSGAILDELERVDREGRRPGGVLVTHHHRDQVQGLARAVAAGIEVWVPPVERDLIEHVDAHWQARGLANTYDTRQDRFSLLEPVPITGVVSEYRPMHCAGLEVLPMPTPGHTVGSVSSSPGATRSRISSCRRTGSRSPTRCRPSTRPSPSSAG